MGCDSGFDVYGDFSQFYDIYVGDWLEDFPFYLEYTRGIQTPVLEIGAGSGRLTIPLARAGKFIVAVDSSASMLSKLRSHLAGEPVDVQQRVQVVECNLLSLALGSKYELIVAPFYTFNYLLTRESQEIASQRLAQHLAAKGLMLIDVFLPLSRIKRCSCEPVLKCDALDAATGNRVCGWNVYSIDDERQIEFRSHIFEVTKPDGTVLKREFTTERRYFYPSELRELFSSNGFSVEAVFTGYKKKVAQADSEQLLYVLRHAKDR